MKTAEIIINRPPEEQIATKLEGRNNASITYLHTEQVFGTDMPFEGQLIVATLEPNEVLAYHKAFSTRVDELVKAGFLEVSE